MIAWTDPKLVRVSLRFANRPSLAGYWKFKTSLLEIRNFQLQLESLIKRPLVGAVTGNRWWVSFKHRIRDFATKYGRQLNLDRTKEAKPIDDRISRAVARRDSLCVELARGDLERESSERYKGYVVRSRLKRVLNEAVKSDATACEVFPIGISILSRLQMGDCCDRIARCVMLFGHTFVIALPAVLISGFRSFAAILPTSPALGWLRRGCGY